MISVEKIKQVLQARFGYTAFKPGQAEVIQAVLSGQDTFAILPTGTGKSLCYQLPGYLLAGQIIVISPLLSLMQDQVAQLHYLGEKSVLALNSALDPVTRRYGLAHLEQYKFVFLSPEMANQPQIRQKLRQSQIDLLVVDEAHCISQWGVDFRPDYLALKSLRTTIQPRATLALTATATKRVQADILAKLGLAATDTKQIIHSVDRRNIYLAIEVVADETEKDQHLVALCQQLKRPGIIYFSSRQKAEEITVLLQQKVTQRVAFYHGAMTSQDRFAVQQQFMHGKLEIICATNAFGMGINKADVRFVIHYHLPSSLESYLQEIGRAGRDGQQSIAILLYTARDFQLQANLVTNTLPEAALIKQYFAHPQRFAAAAIPEIDLLKFYRQHGQDEAAIQQLFAKRRDEKMLALRSMLAFVQTPGCKRQFILDYFTDPTTVIHDPTCCDATQSTNLAELDLQRDPTAVVAADQQQNWQERLAAIFTTSSQL
ncbi:RecQ family ATP-dependent DNA helicase [Loigolactobacillus zhaoyuanensis]|uniref:ATP-dependent DNA helicase RecQ n=1 Tax=Loigolactobacillus zhaoyuanensis TaxID=2486017 RepID=A0ABW8UCP0_9LACO